MRERSERMTLILLPFPEIKVGTRFAKAYKGFTAPEAQQIPDLNNSRSGTPCLRGKPGIKVPYYTGLSEARRASTEGELSSSVL